MKHKKKSDSHFQHLVQFYKTDESLANFVGAFLSSGIETGEGCIIIATAKHRQQLARKLPAGANKNIVMLDAGSTLAQFMIGDMPDAYRFEKTVGSMLRNSIQQYGRVRAFGEMVALLWNAGNARGAIALEKLWNNLGATNNFSLFCAYPLTDFMKLPSAAPYFEVCAVHSQDISQNRSVYTRLVV